MRLIGVFLATAALSLSLPTLAHEGMHEQTESVKLELNAGQKWPTDAPLREAMSGLKTDLEALLPKAHTGQAGLNDFASFADGVEKRVQFMLDNCQLSEKADAQLHVVIAELLAGAKQMRDLPHPGLMRIIKATNAYGEYFEHKDWQAVKLPRDV